MADFKVLFMVNLRRIKLLKANAGVSQMYFPLLLHKNQI